MTEFSPLSVPLDDDAELRAAKAYQEEFGRAHAEELSPRRVKSILFGPSPDGSFLCAAVLLTTGEHFTFSFSVEDAEGIGGALGLAWRSAAELQTLHSAAKGTA